MLKQRVLMLARRLPNRRGRTASSGFALRKRRRLAIRPSSPPSERSLGGPQRGLVRHAGKGGDSDSRPRCQWDSVASRSTVCWSHFAVHVAELRRTRLSPLPSGPRGPWRSPRSALVQKSKRSPGMCLVAGASGSIRMFMHRRTRCVLGLPSLLAFAHSARVAADRAPRRAATSASWTGGLLSGVV